jgi:hypothetical protein
VLLRPCRPPVEHRKRRSSSIRALSSRSERLGWECNNSVTKLSCAAFAHAAFRTVHLKILYLYVCFAQRRTPARWQAHHRHSDHPTPILPLPRYVSHFSFPDPRGPFSSSR